MMDVSVRQARAEDLPSIRELYEGFIEVGGQEGEWVKVFREIDSKEGVNLLVAEYEGKVAGTCILFTVPTLGHGLKTISYAEHVVVDDKLRSKGVGKALMEECIKLAKKSGSYKLIVPSIFPRERAHTFYEKVGFEKRGYVFQIDL